MASPIRVALADDHLLFRQGLKSLLALQPGITVVAEADCVDDLLPMLSRTPCDVLLLDLQMDRNTLGDIRTLSDHVKIIVVTASEDPANALAAVRSGARGIIIKRFAVETLMEALRAVSAGQVWLPPSLQARLAATLREPSQESLTPREREIVRHVAFGLRNVEVAKKLFISEQTVKTHLNNIFRKLGMRDRVELTLYAARFGIIGLHEKAP